MADNGRPFSAEQQSRRLSGRQAQVDQAVERAAPGAGNVTNRPESVKRVRATNMGGAPRGSTSMQTSQSAKSQVENEQAALLRRLNAQSSDSNN